MKTLTTRALPPAILRGVSAAARQLQRDVAAAAHGAEPVLIVAEAGLDAGQVAACLHEPRQPHPFHALDCGTVSAENLMERLFGRAERAARHRRDLEVVSKRSALVSAGRGTLFLANVTEMGAAVQRRLARLVRDGQMYVEDRTHPVTMQARLVASAGPDIVGEVDAGRFLPALHRRFAGCQIALVPLRQRLDDIPAMVRALSDEVASRTGTAPRAFTPAALTALGSLAWPRNLDELRELLARLHGDRVADAARQEDVLRALGFGHAPPVGAVARFDSLRLARQRFEREYIAAVLERHRWRIAEAAETLGIERANLYRKIRQLGLPRPQNGAGGEH